MTKTIPPTIQPVQQCSPRSSNITKSHHIIAHHFGCGMLLVGKEQQHHHDDDDGIDTTVPIRRSNASCEAHAHISSPSLTRRWQPSPVCCRRRRRRCCCCCCTILEQSCRTPSFRGCPKRRETSVRPGQARGFAPPPPCLKKNTQVV